MRVEVNPDLHTKAEFEFGQDHRPDYEDFCLGPLAAAVFACKSGPVAAHPLDGYPGVFTVVLPPSGLFPPLVFSLGLLDGGAVWYDDNYVVDYDYWDLIAQDPEE